MGVHCTCLSNSCKFKIFQNKKLEGKSPMLFAKTVTKLKAYVRQKREAYKCREFSKLGMSLEIRKDVMEGTAFSNVRVLS